MKAMNHDTDRPARGGEHHRRRFGHGFGRAQILRNAIGAFGFIAVAATCAGPFIVVGVHYLAYKAAAGLAASASDGRITKLIANVSAAFGMILAHRLLGMMLYISIISDTDGELA